MPSDEERRARVAARLSFYMEQDEVKDHWKERRQDDDY